MKLSILNIFKGVNGGYEMGRVLWFFGGIGMLVYQGIALHNGQNWDALAFSGGFAVMLAAGGFGIAQKDVGVANARASIMPQPTPINVETAGPITAENVSVERVGG